MPAAGCKSRIVDLKIRILFFKKCRQLRRIVTLSFHTKPQSLQSNLIQKRILWGKTRPRVSEKTISQLRDICHRSEFDIIRKPRVFLFIPLEFATVRQHTADGIAASIDVLRGRVHNDICAMLQWLIQICRCRGVVYHQRNTMGMGYFRQLLHICHIQTGIADGLSEYDSGMVIKCRFYLIPIVICHIICFNSESLKIPEQINGSSIQAGTGDNFISALQNVHKRIKKRCHPGCAGHTGHTSLQLCYPVLKACNCRIANPCVTVTGSLVLKYLFKPLHSLLLKGTGLVNWRQGRPVSFLSINTCMEQACIKLHLQLLQSLYTPLRK